jgi:hypothetical protein
LKIANFQAAQPFLYLSAMSGQTVKKFPEAGRKAAAVISAYMLQAARPLFWHVGVMNNGALRGASTFVLQFPTRHVAVTADHVMAQYLEARKTDPRTICQIAPRSPVAIMKWKPGARMALPMPSANARSSPSMIQQQHWPPAMESPSRLSVST